VRHRLAWTAALLALLFSACSEPPQKEIDQAQAAIDVAKAAGADTYAADEYNAAVTALQKSHASVDQRDYREALNYAIDARQRAAESAKQAGIAKGHTRAAAEKLVTECSTRASQLDTDIRVAESARVPPRDLRSARTTLADAQTALQETRTAMEAGKYAEVASALTEVRRKLDAAIAAVDALRQRPPRRSR
jgi:hypothetical protein